MIEETFLHCHGVGPKTERRLKSAGFLSWKDCLLDPGNLPVGASIRNQLLLTLQKSQNALKQTDIGYFVENFPIREHWRILGDFFDQTTFFDIETSGLSSYSNFVTVITAYHRGKLYTFVYKENLDEFLDLVGESDLLVAFNGNSFDIPFLENSFNIPELGCPYIDLRWICYHEGFTGGLKQIEKGMDITRPKEVDNVSGEEAVSLFYQWQKGNSEAKNKLIAYCQVDTLAAYLVAIQLLHDKAIDVPAVDSKKLFDLIGNLD